MCSSGIKNCRKRLTDGRVNMDVDKRKEALKLALADLRVEAKHLISNIDIALSHLDEVHTEEEAKIFTEKYDIEQGLKHIEIV